jgi:hypothetical protein
MQVEPGYDGSDADWEALRGMRAALVAAGKRVYDERLSNTVVGNAYLVNAFVRGGAGDWRPGLRLPSVDGADGDAAAAAAVAPGFNLADGATDPPPAAAADPPPAAAAADPPPADPPPAAAAADPPPAADEVPPAAAAAAPKRAGRGRGGRRRLTRGS